VLNFTAQTGAGSPASQTFQISSLSALPYTTTAITSPGVGWMFVSPGAGTTPAPVTVSLNTAGLAAGNYTGTILVASTGASNSPQTVTVNLTVLPPPAPLPTIVQNAASQQPGAIAPGEMVFIFGTGMGPAAGVSMPTGLAQAPTTLGETRVFFDDIAAPVTYVSQGQIDTVVPYEIAGRATVRLQVEYRGTRSNTVIMSLTDASPGIMTQNGTGSGAGLILNSDYSLNGAGSGMSAAAKGSEITVFGTGEGSTSPRGETGRILPDDGTVWKLPVLEVSATIGGKPATVNYAGSVPGQISGLFQLKLVVPPDADSGDQPIAFKVGDKTSQSGVTVTVQ
jgi:uncharacterized protein (TIGR03437 family)